MDFNNTGPLSSEEKSQIVDHARPGPDMTHRYDFWSSTSSTALSNDLLCGFAKLHRVYSLRELLVQTDRHPHPSLIFNFVQWKRVFTPQLKANQLVDALCHERCRNANQVKL